MTGPQPTQRQLLTLAQLNDLFRMSMGAHPVFRVRRGYVVATAMATIVINELLPLVQLFDKFHPADNDPYGEHDFGAVELRGQRYFWKIECLEPDLEHAAVEPTDVANTVRVLTIMHASEY